MKNDSVIIWLQNWYEKQCNGDWEHVFGIEILNLDNPGWHVKIDIQETELEMRDLKKIKIERSENDWIFIEKVNGIFDAACGPKNLLEVLSYFRNWAEGP